MASSTTEAPAVALAGGKIEPGKGALPNLIVIGAQKCGTSGLHYYLSFHPEVSMSKPKELNFFIKQRTWSRGVDWYAGHFDAGAKVRGESSPNYTAYPQHMGVPERMHSVAPDAKLIYMVRDPIDRIASHWVHNFAKHREKGTLHETLMHPNTSYLVRSQYHTQLQQFLPLYPIEKILVIDQMDLRDEREQVLREVFEFIGVDPGFEHPNFVKERHQSSQKTRATKLGLKLHRMTRKRGGRFIPGRIWGSVEKRLPLQKPIERPDVHESLPDEALRVLREDAERLRELTGRTFEHWSIWD